jgi:hypothetical protein
MLIILFSKGVRYGLWPHPSFGVRTRNFPASDPSLSSNKKYSFYLDLNRKGELQGEFDRTYNLEICDMVSLRRSHSEVWTNK